jgi:hypothetical protein
MGERKILATMGLGAHAALLAVTLPSFERFADLHGYEIRIPEGDPAPQRRHKHWAKIAFMNELLPECDVLFWIDSDAAIVDPSVDIADALPRSKFLGLVEHHYGGQSVPNTGVMVVRGGRRGRSFFEEVWGHTEYLETRWHDNAAVLTMLGYSFDMEANPMRCGPGRPTRWLRRTHFLGNEWNSLPEAAAASPRIMHVTGSFPFDERLERLRSGLS